MGAQLLATALGLQFHLEVTSESLAQMIDHSRHELKSGKFIQPGEEIVSQPGLMKSSNELIFNILDRLSQ